MRCVFVECLADLRDALISCDACSDVIKKPKLDQHHKTHCRASFTCLDCSQTFQRPDQWRCHTSCISEAQKYERSVWQGDKKEKNKGRDKGEHQQQEAQSSSNQGGKVDAEGSAASADKGKRKRKEERASATASNRENKRGKAKADATVLGRSSSSSVAADGSLRARASKVLMKNASSGASLYETIELLGKTEGGKEKKLRKKLLKGIRVSHTGDLSWT